MGENAGPGGLLPFRLMSDALLNASTAISRESEFVGGAFINATDRMAGRLSHAMADSVWWGFEIADGEADTSGDDELAQGFEAGGTVAFARRSKPAHV